MTIEAVEIFAENLRINLGGLEIVAISNSRGIVNLFNFNAQRAKFVPDSGDFLGFEKETFYIVQIKFIKRLFILLKINGETYNFHSSVNLISFARDKCSCFPAIKVSGQIIQCHYTQCQNTQCHYTQYTLKCSFNNPTTN